MREQYDAGWQERLRVDFSADCDQKEAILQNLLEKIDEQESRQLTEKEKPPMKRSMKNSTRVAIVACLSIVMLSASAFAVVKTLNLGPYAQYTKYEAPTDEDVAKVLQVYDDIRDQWEGKYFDENGQIIEDLDAYMSEGGLLYDKDGKSTNLTLTLDDGSQIAIDGGGDNSDNIVSFTNFDEAKANLCFDAKLPTYLPEGFSFDRFELYKDDNGQVKGSKYLGVYLRKNGSEQSEVYMQIRFMDEETAFEAGNDGSTKPMTINGHDAMSDGRNIDLLIGDVMYMIMPVQSGLSFEEVQRIAESI